MTGRADPSGPSNTAFDGPAFAGEGAVLYLRGNTTRIEYPMELGLYTFADVDAAAANKGAAGAERLKNLLEEIELADQVGLDVFGLGAHHRRSEESRVGKECVSTRRTRW